MRGAVALAVGFGLWSLAAGCQSGKTEQPPSGGSALGSPREIPRSQPPSGGSTPGSPREIPPAPAHVRLPRSPEAPAHRTTKPLGRAQLDQLAAVQFPDFDRQDRGAADGVVEVRHTTKTRPRLGVTVTIGPCTKARACPAMELAGWTARRDELEHELPKELLGRPDTRFELGARTIAGAPAIYTYQLGYSAGTDEKDQPSVDYTDAYIVYYNDGKNQLRVMAHYLDDALGGIDPLLAVAPPEDLEKLAVAFASFYVRSWN